MIRDFFLITLNGEKCLMSRSYCRTPLDINLVLGFFSAMRSILHQKPELTPTSLSAGSLIFTLAYYQDLIIIISSDENLIEESLFKKSGTIISKIKEMVEKKYISFEMEPNSQIFNNLVEFIDVILFSIMKIALVGFGGVGKTTIFRLIQGHDIPLDHLPTMFVQYKKLECKFTDTEILIWDFAGEEKFTPVWPLLLRGTNVIFIVTDSTIENVLNTKRVFMKLIRKVRPDAIYVGIANKQDMAQAIKPELIKRILNIDLTYSLCAIDPSEKRKLQQIILHSIECFQRKERGLAFFNVSGNNSVQKGETN